MRLKLIVQISLITGIVLFFTSALFGYFNISTLKHAFLESTVTDLDHLSETILRTVFHQMLKNDRDEIQVTIREVAQQKGIEQVRLINREGVVALSTGRAGISAGPGGVKAPACIICHNYGMSWEDPSPMARSRMFLDSNGNKVLGLVKPIYNEKVCWTGECHTHSRDTHLLGLLDITISAAPMLSKIRNYRNNTIIQILFLILSISLCLTLLTQRLIVKPVHTLLEHTRAVGRGKWRFIESVPGDELGELAEAFNDMTGKLKKAREERDEWAATLETRVEERTRKIKEMQSVLIRSEKLASLGELVAGIAHELNNPLTGIMIHAPFIAEDPRLDEGLKEDCQTIIHEAKRCSRIVRKLLDFARVSDPQKTMQSVNEAINRSIALIEHHADFNDIEIVKEYAPDLPNTLMDASQIEQVFINMMVNASQAMPAGGKLTIGTGLNAAGDSIYIRIEDTGCGIPKENMEKLFDPFFSTKGNKGTGLGLSVSYGIIQSHGGEIEVDSKPDRGTVFIITLPVA
ncbi:MAG TPA: sensor histidine kinase [Proteobacteria bacterium]|nr:sensor protein ZraS [bacterium BMS3Abin14]HDL53178.1 sensor histidine kinase [Pseudomonadota bacterium]